MLEISLGESDGGKTLQKRWSHGEVQWDWGPARGCAVRKWLQKEGHLLPGNWPQPSQSSWSRGVESEDIHSFIILYMDVSSSLLCLPESPMAQHGFARLDFSLRVVGSSGHKSQDECLLRTGEISREEDLWAHRKENSPARLCGCFSTSALLRGRMRALVLQIPTMPCAVFSRYSKNFVELNTYFY